MDLTLMHEIVGTQSADSKILDDNVTGHGLDNIIPSSQSPSPCPSPSPPITRCVDDAVIMTKSSPIIISNSSMSSSCECNKALPITPSADSNHTQNNSETSASSLRLELPEHKEGAVEITGVTTATTIKLSDAKSTEMVDIMVDDLQLSPSGSNDSTLKADDDNQELQDFNSAETMEPSRSESVSQCRYCYGDLAKSESVSQCLCSGVLCRECLIKELRLTHNRNNNKLQCTVCKSEYKVKTEFTFNLKKDCKSLCGNFLIHCGLKDEQYLLDSVGGKIGFFLVILGINTWILSTSLLFAFPPNGCPVELYYMVSVFDFAVGISTIWFIVKCRYLSPLFLSGMYLIRFLYILLGWIPAINLCNIYVYHHRESNHIAILAYFLIFSLIAFIVMCICWIIDFRHQYAKYSKENGKLILHKNDIRIEINHILESGHEADSF